MTQVSTALSKKINGIFPNEDEIPEDIKLPQVPYEQHEYLINGEIKNWDGPLMSAISPVCVRTQNCACQKNLGSYPLMSPKEAFEALDAAQNAYNNGRGVWPTMSVEERIKCINNFVYEMQKCKSEMVKLLMWEIGKTLADAEKEFDRTVDYIKDTIDALKDLDRNSSRFVMEKGIIGKIRRSPLGVVLCMGPYNYPLNETFTTLIPALIMGNTVIFKPPSLGVLVFRPLLKAFKECFPKGVVNTIYGKGREITPPLMESGKVDVLAFIGSSKAAGSLKSKHPKPHRLKSVLGLEAKNPAIILPDCNLDDTIKECILGTLSYNGQRCTALKIIFVHKSIVDKFLEKLSLAIESLEFGVPWKKNVFVTPLPEPGKALYLKELVDDAVSKGAKVINSEGGTVIENFFYPALVYPVNDQMKLYHVEQFGPVIPVVPFENVEEPLNFVISSNYGQQVSIFGKDTNTIAGLIDPLINQVSRVNINSQCQRGPDTFPFTGRKDSAEATLSVSDALRVFSIRALVAAKDSELNKDIINDIVQNNRSNFLSNDFIF